MVSGIADAVGDRAGDDVDFVEPGAGDEELRLLDAGAAEHFFARAAADDEFDVDGGKGVGDRPIVVDHDHFVVRRERAGQR